MCCHNCFGQTSPLLKINPDRRHPWKCGSYLLSIKSFNIPTHLITVITGLLSYNSNYLFSSFIINHPLKSWKCISKPGKILLKNLKFLKGTLLCSKKIRTPNFNRQKTLLSRVTKFDRCSSGFHFGPIGFFKYVYLLIWSGYNSLQPVQLSSERVNERSQLFSPV